MPVKILSGILVAQTLFISAPGYANETPQSAGFDGHQMTEPLAEIPEVVKSVVPTPDIPARSWMLVDFESGWIIGSKDKDLRVEPASFD